MPGFLLQIELHGFGYASKKGCSATVYAVVKQGKKQELGLLVSKSRIAKKDLTVRRLELVAAHVVANLLENVPSLVLMPGLTAQWSCVGLRTLASIGSNSL